MNMNKICRLSFMIILVIGFGYPSLANAGYFAKKIATISQIQTEYGEDNEVTLTIKGKSFLRRRGRVPYISIGSDREYDLLSFSNSQLVVSTQLSDGDHLIRVSKSRKFRSYRTVAYALTIGEVGPTGEPGIAGVQGKQGADGPAGAAGPDGPQGPMGIPGPMGAQGPQGLTGPIGPPGPVGDRGQQGAKGPPGELQGPPGDHGPDGQVAQHVWDGTRLSFQQPDGSWTTPLNLQGQGIDSLSLRDSCILFAAIYQDYQNEASDNLVKFGRDFYRMNELCYETTPQEFKTMVDTLIAEMENEILNGQSNIRARSQTSGSTTIELLLVNPIVGIISAIAIPSYSKMFGINKARFRAGYNGTISRMRSIVSSQALFRDTDKDADGNANFANPLQVLVDYNLIESTEDAWGYDFIFEGTDYSWKAWSYGIEGERDQVCEANDISEDVDTDDLYTDDSGVIRKCGLKGPPIGG